MEYLGCRITPKIEYHVSDFCNLRCKRCGHFSNLVSEKVFPDINDFRNNLNRLAGKFNNITKFRLMGGEPFINPDLSLFIYELRKIFPYTEIRVVTNGLLFPKINIKTIEAIRKCGVFVEISQYPPTRKMIGDIITFAQNNNIRIIVGNRITKFMRQLDVNINENFQLAHQMCMSKSCHFLREGHLYPCGWVCLLYENRKFFDLDISKEMVDRNSIDLFNEAESGWDILKKITEPSEFCKYCSSNPEWFDWKFSEKTIRKEDWIVGGVENIE